MNVTQPRTHWIKLNGYKSNTNNTLNNNNHNIGRKNYEKKYMNELNNSKNQKLNQPQLNHVCLFSYKLFRFINKFTFVLTLGTFIVTRNKEFVRFCNGWKFREKLEGSLCGDRHCKSVFELLLETLQAP